MILARIKHYLMQRGEVSLGDIARHVDSSPDAVRGMLEQWIRRGKVERHRINDACGSRCNQCQPETTEFYRWAETDNPSTTRLPRE